MSEPPGDGDAVEQGIERRRPVDTDYLDLRGAIRCRQETHRPAQSEIVVLRIVGGDDRALAIELVEHLVATLGPVEDVGREDLLGLDPADLGVVAVHLRDAGANVRHDLGCR